MKKNVKKIIAMALLSMNLTMLVACNKEDKTYNTEPKQEQNVDANSKTEGQQQQQTEAKKSEESIKEVAKEEILKLEAWESDKINEATAEEFFFKHAQKLHSFKPELLDEYLAFIKPMMVDYRYQYFEKSFKKAKSENVMLEYTKATMTKIEKSQWEDVRGYTIYYDIIYKENGTEKTEKALAQLKVIDGEFKINDYWQNP